MSPRKSKRGRPPLKQGEAKSVLIQVRVTPEEAKAIEEQASQSQKPRSEWIRRRLIPPGDAKAPPKTEDPKPQPPAGP
ncbi:MAG: hypothetical protein K8T20_20720 [Planctomycetes bacterium]|nr:hypothetical protein [Planctomycetota bacterium]